MEASDEAARHGVKVGDAVRLARRRCPGLVVKELRPEDYAEKFEQTWSVIADFTPMIETTDLHKGYLDITQDAHRFGGCDEFMRALTSELLKRTGQAIRWGGGADKWLAFLVRDQDQFITPPIEYLVLTRLPVDSMLLPEQVAERLHHFDIHTVWDLLNLPDGFLESNLRLNHDFVLRRLTRRKEVLHPNFPPRSVFSAEEIVDQDELRLDRAVSNVSRNLVGQLGSVNMQPSSLRLTFRTKRDVVKLECKLAQTDVSQPRIERILLRELPITMRKNLRALSVEARGLLPVPSRQDTLWGDRGKLIREQAVERVQSRLESRFGTTTLLTGSELIAKHIPRFAQLVYRTRGLTLP
ncbi:MAG: hypothetical protein IT459_23845 [Planctomycetes bacterium]|nr:hypothetical protein [Planctomycetota bacterium]